MEDGGQAADGGKRAAEARRRGGDNGVFEARWTALDDGLWRPVAAPKDFKADGDWSVTQRRAGPQLTYKGDPLYSFTGKSLDDAANHTLYAAKSGKACATACDGLKPFSAPLAALPIGEWRPVVDKGGERVRAYRGRIVYQAQSADADAPGDNWSRLEVR